MPRISVLMPVYNVEHYITDAVVSILNQTYSDLELLVMDDGSTDGTLSKLEELSSRDDRLRVFSRSNRKVASCLNELVELASGEYVARMDGDDLAMPNRLARQIAYLEYDRQCAVVGSWVDTFGDRCERWHYRRWDNFSRNLLCFGVTILCHPTWMLRRSLLRRYPYDDSFRTIIDKEWLARVALNEPNLKFVALPEVLLRYRIHHQSVSGRFASEQERKTHEVVGHYLAGLSASLDENTIKQFMAVSLCKPMGAEQRFEAAQLVNDIRYAIAPVLPDEFGVFAEKWIQFCIANNSPPATLELVPNQSFTYLAAARYQSSAGSQKIRLTDSI